MKNHLLLLLVFGILTSMVLAFITKDGMKDRIKYFFFLLCSFFFLSLLTGWLMYPFPF